MNRKTSELVRLSGALVTRSEELIQSATERAARICDPDEVEEVLLQSHLFLGYPAALGALRVWRDVSGRPASESQGEAPRDWTSRGERTCRMVYGPQYDALVQNVASLHPEMGRWMVVDGYGRVLGRPGLALVTRELAIVGLLAVLDAPVQLYSHLRGALRVGATEDQLECALSAVEDFMAKPVSDRAWDCWEEVKARCSSTV